MITFLDERDVEHGALATIKVTNAVNGERSLTGEIESGDYVLANIERGWRLRFEDEFYVVTYAKPVDDEKATHVTFDAIHQFFWDFDKSSVHEQLNDGSHTVLNYLDFIFADSGYTYTIDPLLKVYAFEKQSFGYKSRLNLFNDIITASGVEFQVNGKVVRILEKTGTDLSTVVRKNFNMNELGIEKHIGDFVTYQKGFGAWVDENDHTKGRLVTEYTSPLASVYGKLEAEPLVDERYTQADNMIAVLKANVDNSYSISVRLDMEDLTRAGYEYTQPRAGDYIMAINEILDFQEKIRIVSFTSEYDVTGQLIKHEVTCNDIGAVKKLSASYNLTKEQAQNASDSVGKAVEMANKALVSADGKSTVYFGNEFPKDEPKGTLHKGDSLYLTVGDTTKMYYWTGADWEELPIVNDVEAFKEQIADELKDVPNREEFEATITEKLATSKAEIKTQIDTAKTQAESNAKAYADEINQATAEVAEQANTAANSLKSDLAKVKTDLTTTTSTANAAKTSASEAKQQLTTVANDLSKAKTDLKNAVSEVDTKATNLQSDLTKAKQDLTSQASQLTAQANAQSELTKRVSTVEETAIGTKSTVGELSKTVDSNTKNITSVTARTKTVEDDLTSTKTTLSQVKTTADGASQKTATLETGLNGLNAKFETLQIGSRNYFKNSKSRKYYIDSTETQDVRTFIDDEFWQNDTRFTKNYVRMSFDIAFNPALPSNFTTNVHFSASPWYNCGGITFKGGTTALQHFDLKFNLSGAGDSYKTDNVFIRLNNTLPLNTAVSLENFKLYLSAVVEDYSRNEADIESKVAEYKQTADQNYASLQTTVQNLDGTVQQNKTTAEQTAAGFKTRIESLETYKNSENIRANQYFESAKTETARQLTAERTAIANDYVAKSTYTSDVTGIRNDLTATTTTANTTKTNLANYQASNDKVVANLQSNLQTANGNISSLQTKIEAVPGQITSAVSAVEGKIPTSIGGRNLWIQSKTTGGFVEETLPDNHITGQKKCYRITNNAEIKFNIEPDFSPRLYRTVTFSAWVKYENVVQGTNSWNVFNLFKHEMYRKNSSTGLTTSIDYTTLKGFTGTSDWKYVTYTYDYAANKSYDQLKTTIRFNLESVKSGTAWVTGVKIEVGSIPSDYSPAPEDTESDINAVSSQIKQTADGMTLLATKTELNAAKSDLQSGISTATSKADNAQATANNNAQTISTHTTQISALNTGLSAKVSKSDFDSLSGRVTTAENNITATANELNSKITSVEGKIPKSVGGANLFKGSRDFSGTDWVNKNSGIYAEDYQGVKIFKKQTLWGGVSQYFEVKTGEEYVFSAYVKSSAKTDNVTFYLVHESKQPMAEGLVGFDSVNAQNFVNFDLTDEYKRIAVKIKITKNGWIMPRLERYNSDAYLFFGGYKLERGNIPTDWSPAPEDYDSKLASAQSEIKQTTDSISATVSALDNSTVKSASLTINTDGIVMKAGKSTTDVANAIGSYFAVNQNAINLFSDKINVKGSMIVDGAITSDKIASKQINTAHFNGKIITADVISSNAVTADAIKAGAVTTDKMSANSINGDRITAGTLDAAKIKAGSISASQIASGTLTSEQIKAGAIKSINIEASAITSDKIASNSIDASKIVTNGLTANIIKGGKLQSLSNATNFELDTGKLFYNNNNTGVFRVEDGASTMGLKFTNTAITVNGSSKVLSRVILGGDRRESTLDDGKWDQGGFTGIVAETINGVASNTHDKADTLRAIADNIYFTHSYETDALTGVSAAGWKMETYAPDTSYKGNVVLKPYGVSYRQSNIVVGDLRLDNGDGSGYWMRATINVLKACFGHIVNGGVSGDALSAIRSELNKISGT
ncbi:phage tail protein [Streptococcus infantarius]|uniref:phage tail protein n=1 Tax=Streptococcus infantarius TaxID=102684 RepID=UPI0022E1510B|nr:phage tail protein [Streptococcus infantarius]